MLDIQAATAETEFECTADRGAKWKVKIVPLLSGELRECIRAAVGVDDGAVNRIAALRVLRSIVSADGEDGTALGLRSLTEEFAFTDPRAKRHYEIILRSYGDLSDAIATEAVKLGEKVEGQRGNLQPAPV